MKYSLYLAIAAALVITGCGKSSETEPVSKISSATGTEARTVEQRQVPEFNRLTLSGDSLSRKDLEGQVTIVNFWATWCGPCVIETPALVSLRNELHDRGFEVVGVSMDEEGLDVVHEFADRFNISYPLIHDSGDLAEAFGGVFALPSSYLVNKEGKIVHRIVGVFPFDEMRGTLEELLAEETTSE